MKGDRGTADFFRDLVQGRLLPGLEALGFADRVPGSLVACEADGVVWMLDLPVAPWSNSSKVCFAVAWGVHVRGLDEIVGDPVPETPGVDTCALSGRLGDREDRLDPRWFEFRTLPWPVAGMATTTITNHVLSGVASEVLPKLRTVESPAAVQRFLSA